MTYVLMFKFLWWHKPPFGYCRIVVVSDDESKQDTQKLQENFNSKTVRCVTNSEKIVLAVTKLLPKKYFENIFKSM